MMLKFTIRRLTVSFDEAFEAGHEVIEICVELEQMPKRYKAEVVECYIQGVRLSTNGTRHGAGLYDEFVKTIFKRDRSEKKEK